MNLQNRPAYTYPKEIQIGGQKMKCQKTCKCGKVFDVKPSLMNNPSKKYCSISCRDKYYESTVKAKIHKFICPQCSKEFEKVAGSFDRKSINHYCSRACADLARRNRRAVNCAQCGKTFERSVSRTAGIKSFCTASCKYEYAKENPNSAIIGKANNSGKNNGQYKHGKYAGRNRPGGSTLKAKVKSKVAELDGNWCFMCGKPGPGLHLHRVIYGSQGGKYEVTNCVLLCGKHHEEVHASKKTWLPVLQSHLRNRDHEQQTS